MKNLTLSEESSIKSLLHEPHFSYIESTLINKKGVAYLILQKKEVDIFLIASSGFYTDSVFAGLTEKHIEYVAKNAPGDYKKNILNILKDAQAMQSVFEIVKSMDDDIARGATQNQVRINNVIQYIKDNRIVFEF